MSKNKESDSNQKQIQKFRNLQKDFMRKKDLSGIMKLGDLSQEWHNSKFVSQQERVLKTLKEIKEKDPWLNRHIQKFTIDTNGKEFTLLVKLENDHPILLAEFIFQKEILVSKANQVLRRSDLPLISEARVTKY